MADDVAITAGSGTSIATDDCTSGHVQLVKIAYSADGNRTHTTVDADGVLVNLGANNDVTITGSITNISGTVSLPTGASTLAEQQTQTTALQLIDDTVFTLGTGTYAEATTKGLVVGAIRRDADTTAVNTDNEVAPLLVNAIGALKVEIFDGGDSHTVDGTVTANAGTNLNTSALALESGGNIAASATSLALIDDAIKADDAGFTVGTDKVNMAGHVAVAHGSNPDAADANDAVAALTNRHRIPFIIGGHPNIVTIKHANITTAVTDTAIITISTGSKIVVTSLMVTLDNASTVFPSVLIGFGTANTPTTTGVIAAHGGVPAGGGFSRGDGSGIIGIGADNEDLRITTVGNATGNGLQVVVTYYTIES